MYSMRDCFINMCIEFVDTNSTVMLVIYYSGSLVSWAYEQLTYVCDVPQQV